MGGVDAGEMTTLQAVRARPPNPGGRRGSPKHRGRVVERADELEAEGYTIEAGGRLPEQAVQTPNGQRFPDITARDANGKLRYEQIGRTNKDGTPVARERRNMDDIEAGTGTRPHFTPYNP